MHVAKEVANSGESHKIANCLITDDWDDDVVVYSAVPRVSGCTIIDGMLAAVDRWILACKRRGHPRHQFVESMHDIPTIQDGNIDQQPEAQ